MAESRTANSIRNSGMSVLAQIVSIILNFIGRTFFIKLLNIDYLGVNGLFTNILTLLSLAELGVGTAIVYMMYDPIAKGDIKKVAAFNNLIRKIYIIIGCFILVSGLCVTPFLGYVIKDTLYIKENISIIYILFLLNTSVSYFFTYKRSLLIAHQKEYLNSKNVIYFAIIKDLVLIVVLLLSQNYYLYLISQIVITFFSNWAISRVADKMYPEIVKLKEEKITNEEKVTIAKNTMGMVCHKIGSVIVSGTDNILISSYVGIGAVGIFSNYKLIQSVSKQVISQAVNSVTASVGNLRASSDNDRVYEVFKKLYFINFTMSYFISIMFYALVDSFITIWIGSDFILNNLAVVIITVNLFFNQIRIPSQVIINSYGIFWEIKWKSIIEAIINLIASVSFAAVMHMGLTGILLGSIISNLATNLWWEPYAAYHYGMYKPLREYMYMFVRDVTIFCITLTLVYIVNKTLAEMCANSILLFIYQLCAGLFVSIAIFVLLCHRDRSFSFLTSTLIQLFRTILRK